ncbi:hypothetical protein [Paenibacillus sp. L3-i20]|uniref:hypothetical protein n=1 Tax=Paenibacillus sp. L3-i20 TaxID=2905833 RepID=UPI001EDFCE34|nr:hypothetical protein [Paenibacillus sp. L3-i20]GKU76907.1 hypothetical protein L3i20_v213040 [Paenibacillus sp. L3-i20]
MKKVILFSASVLVATSLAVSTVQVPVTFAAAKPKPTNTAKPAGLVPFKGADFKKFMISSKSYIQIKDIYFLYGGKEKQVFYTLSVYNGDNSTIDFMDYWVELQSTAGATYTTKPHASNSKSGKVPSKTKKDFVFYSQVDSTVNYNNLIFNVVKWDFSLPNYTKKIGKANVTSAYKNAVPANAYSISADDNSKVKTSLNAGTVFTMGATSQIQVDLNMENIGSFEYKLPNYQFYIRTKSGLVLKMASEPIDTESIAVGEKVKYTLRTSAKKGINLTGAQILVTDLDAEAKIETPRSIFEIGWGKDNKILVGENKTASISIAGNNVNSSIVNVYADQNGTQNEIILTTKWLNKGAEAVILPKYKYEILASNGVKYPVTLSEAEGDQTLVPGVEKEVMFQAVLPVTLSDGLTLVVKQPKDEKNKLEYVSAAFKLSKIQELKGVSTKTYTSTKGLYEIKIKQAERLPWGSQDIINLFIDIENKGKKSQAIPDIAAILRLNGLLVKEDKTSLIKLDSAGIIEPGQSTRYVLTTKVPYMFDFNEITLSLSDKINEKSKQTIGLFKLDEINKSPELSYGSTYKIDSVGRRATVEFLNTFLFTGKDRDMLYAEFKYTNKESRQAKLPVLKAYFKTSDGQFIEANLPLIKTSVKPDGTAIMTATAPVPKTFNKDESVQLIIGEALNGAVYSGQDGISDSYISAQAFKLPKMQQDHEISLTNLKLEPYTFTLDKLNTMLNDVSNVKLEMDYTLLKPSIYDVVEKETKLYFEISNGKHSYGTSVKVEPVEGEGLQAGEKKKIIVPIQGNQLGDFVYNGYIINIYEDIDGYKRLLGTKKFGSFQVMSPTPAAK